MDTARRRWIAVLAGGMLATLMMWFLSTPAPQPALGQVPDAGAQRQQMIDELRQSNIKLDEIARLLREIRDARPRDDRKEAPSSRPARP